MSKINYGSPRENIPVRCPRCNKEFLVNDPHVDVRCPNCYKEFLGMTGFIPRLEDIKGCWRCDGKGIVTAYDGRTTPCGACLGVVKPRPCPKCGSEKMKSACDFAHVFWRCRDCGYEGPCSNEGLDALHLHNNNINKGDVK
jgi:predicted RNA-binding Zn-ribbon protein involved in translation (DUF1610 family)